MRRFRLLYYPASTLFVVGFAWKAAGAETSLYQSILFFLFLMQAFMVPRLWLRYNWLTTAGVGVLSLIAAFALYYALREAVLASSFLRREIAEAAGTGFSELMFGLFWGLVQLSWIGVAELLIFIRSRRLSGSRPAKDSQ
jgi:hypothetical protein